MVELGTFTIRLSPTRTSVKSALINRMRQFSMTKILMCYWGIVLLTLTKGSAAESPSPALPGKDLPLPGDVFAVEGRTAFLIAAKGNTEVKGKPWIWYAPTLPGLPGKEEVWMFERFLQAGISIVGMDVGESFGSPAGNKSFTALYDVLTKQRGYSPKPVLLGRSRGGWRMLSWAAENSDRVGAFE